MSKAVDTNNIELTGAQLREIHQETNILADFIRTIPTNGNRAKELLASIYSGELRKEGVIALINTGLIKTTYLQRAALRRALQTMAIVSPPSEDDQRSKRLARAAALAQRPAGWALNFK
jgi:hypothetical protein